MNKDERIAQLEEEVRELKAQLEQRKENDFPVGEELRKRRDTLETFDKMPNGTIYHSVRDVQTGILGFDYVSSSWEKILGVTAEASMDNAFNVFKNAHPDDLNALMQLINESLEPLRNFDIEVRYLHPVMKKEIWIQISSYPRLIGNHIVADGFIFDITNRKTAEIELGLEKMRLQALTNNLPDVVLFQFIINTQTEQNYFSYVSDKWEAVIGIPAEAALNSTEAAFAIVHPDDLPLLIDKIENCLMKLENMYLEFRLIVHGRIRWVQQTGRPRREGELIISDAILLDITERKTAEIALAENERKHRFVFDNIRDLYWIMDMKTSKFTFMAGSGYQMYGFTNEEIMQQDLCELFDEPTKKKVNLLIDDKINEYHKTGIIQNFQFEELQYRKDGSRFWVECSYQLVPDESGEITQLVGIDRDVDIRKRMEIELATYREDLEFLVKERTEELSTTNEELASTNEELTVINEELDCFKTQLEQMVEQKTVELVYAKEKAEESDRLKSAFLANMSHEIRTPLNGIVGMLQFIEADDPLPDQRKEYFNIINSSSTHLVNLIDDIIDISKIEAQQMTICPVPVRLNEMMNELLIFFRTYLRSINKGNVVMLLNASGFIDRCVAKVDPLRLRQTLNNLIGNAIKFTEDGYIRFGYRQSSPDQLEFVVEDTGIGLPFDQQEIIFERFRQSQFGYNRQYGGTGLGLSISRSLVQMMGGSMWVKSTEGEGSSFYFTIPYLPVALEDIPVS